MKNNMYTKTSLSETIDSKRSSGRKCRIARDSMVENVNLMMHNVGKHVRIDRWMMHSKDVSNYECMVKNMVFRNRSSTTVVKIKT